MTPDARMSVSMMREGLKDFLGGSKRQPKIAELKMSGDGEFSFLGTSINVPQLEQRVFHVALTADLSELRTDVRRFPGKREFQLEWAATPLSETFLRSARERLPEGVSPESP